jgi:RNA methyltransferase, TrmH family
MKLKKYTKNSDVSYALGVSSVIELLKNRPNEVLFVAIKTGSEKNAGIQKIKDMCEKQNITVSENNRLIERVTNKGNIFAVGVFKKYASEIDMNKNTVVLVNPSQRGNVGTIIRTMCGFGINNLAVIKPAVDAFHPETIRASIGRIFGINVEYYENFGEYKNKTQNNIYCMMTDGEKDLEGAKFQKPFSLVFGSEGQGLNADFKEYGSSIKIRQSKNIDSFNLAISAGITLFEATKKTVDSERGDVPTNSKPTA